MEDIGVLSAEHHSDVFKIDFISKIETHPNLLYADTDSCIKDTNLIINDKEITIEEFYNTSEGVEIPNNINNYIKVVEDKYLSPSVSKDLKLERNVVKYIMKHKVKKRFFKIKLSNKELEITEDHSLMVLRDGKLISIKPEEVRADDKLFKIYRKTFELKECSDFEIVDIGIKEEWVYDLEIENNHNFFGNGILIHNSSYNYFKVPFNKYENIHRTVNYSQKVAKDCNIKYKNFFDTVLKTRANIDPKWNFMNFKSEVIATRGFFNTKKNYALAKIWMEGTFYEELEIKKTGGQILKADTSAVTLEFLKEIYDILTVRVEFNTIEKIKHEIYDIIKKKYIEIITKNINEFNFKEFVVPKKWPTKTTKTIPTHIQGSMLYNLIFDDQLRPGDSLLMVPVVINKNLLYKKYQYYKKSNYQLPNELIGDKLNILSFPSDLEFTDEKKQEIILKLQQLDIRIDFERILNFNIGMKLAAFDKLFLKGK